MFAKCFIELLCPSLSGCQDIAMWLLRCSKVLVKAFGVYYSTQLCGC